MKLVPYRTKFFSINGKFHRTFSHKGFEESMGKRYLLAELGIMILMKWERYS